MKKILFLECFCGKSFGEIDKVNIQRNCSEFTEDIGANMSIKLHFIQPSGSFV